MFTIIDHEVDPDWDRERYECQHRDWDDRYACGETPEKALWSFVETYSGVSVVDYDSDKHY